MVSKRLIRGFCILLCSIGVLWVGVGDRGRLICMCIVFRHAWLTLTAVLPILNSNPLFFQPSKPFYITDDHTKNTIYP